MGTRAPLIAAAAVLALLGGSAAARPSGTHVTAACVAGAGGAARTAANELLALPWRDLSKQYEHDTTTKIEQALEGNKFANRPRKGGDLEWQFYLKTEAVHSSADFSAPPGFSSVAPDCFAVGVPLSGAWSFSFASDVETRARVWYLGNRIFSSTPRLHLGFQVKRFRLAARAELDASNPARPLFRKAVLEPEIQIGGDGLIPTSLTINLETVVKPNGRIEFVGRLTNADIDLAGLGKASFDGELVLALRPSGFTVGAEVDLEHDVGSEVRRSEYVVGDTINVSAAFQDVDVTLKGDLAVSLKRIGKVKVPWSLTFPAVLPSSSELIALQNTLQRPAGCRSSGARVCRGPRPA